MDDLPQRFVIRESSHRIHNPFTSEKLAALGRALHLSPGTSALGLACGSGEMLCTWARDHGLTGTGIDVSTAWEAATGWIIEPSYARRQLALLRSGQVGTTSDNDGLCAQGSAAETIGQARPPGRATSSPSADEFPAPGVSSSPMTGGHDVQG